MSNNIISTTVEWDDGSEKEMDIDLNEVSAISPVDNHSATAIYGNGFDGWIINEPYFKFKTIWKNLKSIPD